MSGTIDAYGTLITGTVNCLNLSSQTFSTNSLSSQSISSPEVTISDFKINQSNDKLVFTKDNEALLRLSKNTS